MIAKRRAHSTTHSGTLQVAARLLPPAMSSPFGYVHRTKTLREFGELTQDNDPYGEHDFGCIHAQRPIVVLENRLFRPLPKPRIARSGRWHGDDEGPDDHVRVRILIRVGRCRSIQNIIADLSSSPPQEIQNSSTWWVGRNQGISTWSAGNIVPQANLKAMRKPRPTAQAILSWNLLV
jgi:hypothetical protein